MKRSADAVIIGGGCMGASTAYHLTRLGLTDLVLIEREPMFGMGSTGRNAGGVRHQFSTEANVRLSIESINTLEHFESEIGYPIDFWQDGYLFLLSESANLAAFKKNIEMQRRLGIDVDLLMPQDAQKLVESVRLEGVVGASFCARDGIADPNGVTMGFIRAAQSRGLQASRETEVTSIKVERDKVKAVNTTNGEISTGIVINAAGPNARAIGKMAGLEVPVLPYRRHIFITEPITDGSIPSNRIMVIDFESTFYFHREGPGLLFGMSDPSEPSSFDTTVSWDLLERVTNVAMRRLPSLGDAGIAHAWAGLYEMTPDAMPIIGPAREVEGYFIIAGFSGHGFQHCPAAGRVVADLIVTGSASGFDPEPFDFDRFKKGSITAEANVI